MKSKFFILVLLVIIPSLSSAEWLALNGCTQNTVQPTCLKALESCSANYSYNITQSILTLEPDGVTPAFVNITYDVTYNNPSNGDPVYTLYNQGDQCGWSAPACTTELPYDPKTEACKQPPQFLTCGYSSVLNFFPSVSGFSSADSAGIAFCKKIDALDNIDYPFIGNAGSGVNGYGGDIFTTCGDNAYTNFLTCSLVTCSAGEILDYSNNTCINPRKIKKVSEIKNYGAPSCDITIQVGGNN